MNEEHDNSLSDNQTIKGVIIDLRLVVDQLGKNFTRKLVTTQAEANALTTNRDVGSPYEEINSADFPRKSRRACKRIQCTNHSKTGYRDRKCVRAGRDALQTGSPTGNPNDISSNNNK